MNRYAGKPFLRLLELYVLWCIGALTAQDEQTLETMTPKLRATYERNGSWYEIIEAVMDLPVAARDEVRKTWQAQSGMLPQHFAEQFVDAHLT